MNWKLIVIKLNLLASLAAFSQQNAPAFDAEEELLQIQSLLLSSSEMDSVVDKVVKESYALKMSAAEVSSLKEEAKMEHKSWMRSFTVGVNMFGYNVTPSSVESANTTQVSVLSNAAMTLLISPYDLIGQKNRIRRAKHRVAMHEMSLNDKRRQIKIYITNKFLEYQAALESYIISENRLMISEELKHVADESFRRGTMNNIEYNKVLGGVMQTRLGLLQVETQVMKLKYEIEILMHD